MVGMAGWGHNGRILNVLEVKSFAKHRFSSLNGYAPHYVFSTQKVVGIFKCSINIYEMTERIDEHFPNFFIILEFSDKTQNENIPVKIDNASDFLIL